MSDGPYRSLPMRRSWKRAAKCAYQEAYSEEEIVDAVTRASHADWRAEVSPTLLARLTKVLNPVGQQGLFSDQTLADLCLLQPAFGSPLEACLIRNVVDAVRDGCTGAQALRQAAEGAINDRLLSNYRSVEEHVRRDDSVANARFVRGRLESAHRHVNVAGLAGALLNQGPKLTQSVKSTTDLDAGVKL